MGFNDLGEWTSRNDLINQHHGHLRNPYFLRGHVLPDSAKEKARKMLDKSKVINTDAFISYLMNPYTEEEKNAFIEYIKKKDKLRGTNILDYCPEFEEWFS